MKLRFVRFCASSFIGFAVDNGIFMLMMALLVEAGMWRRNAILVSMIAARVISSFVNFLGNRLMVFRSHADCAVAVWRYYALVVLVMTASYLLTSGACFLLDAKGVLITLIKIVVETLLFVVSFRAQRGWVYRPSRTKRERA